MGELQEEDSIDSIEIRISFAKLAKILNFNGIAPIGIFQSSKIHTWKLDKLSTDLSFSSASASRE
jgi:hypothetical protein